MSSSPKQKYMPIPLDFLLLEVMPEQGTIGGVHWKGRQVRDMRDEVAENTGTEITSDTVATRCRVLKAYGFARDFGTTQAGTNRIWARTAAGNELLSRKEAVLNG